MHYTVGPVLAPALRDACPGFPPCSAGLGGGGAKALAGTIVMRNVSVARNSAADGGAFEVAKQEGSNLFPTMLLVSVSFLLHCFLAAAGHLPQAFVRCAGSAQSSMLVERRSATMGRQPLHPCEGCGVQDSVVSGNTATGQGSVCNVGNAEMVSFTNVTFDENSGDLGHRSGGLTCSTPMNKLRLQQCTAVT